VPCCRTAVCIELITFKILRKPSVDAPATALDARCSLLLRADYVAGPRMRPEKTPLAGEASGVSY
jgi:hypothetical protein